jgi:hypothetical protein
MFCIACGRQMPNGSAFCSRRGRSLSQQRDKDDRIICHRCRKPVAGKTDDLTTDEAENIYCQCDELFPSSCTSLEQPPDLDWYDKWDS